MSTKFRLLSGIAALGKTRAAADDDTPSTPPTRFRASTGGDDDGGDGEQQDVVLATDAQTAIAAAREEGRLAGVKQGTDAGATAERDRTSAVLTSEEGKANMTLAAFMLSSNPTATSETIIGHLKTAPKSATTTAAPQGEPDRLKGALEQIPPVKTGGAKAGSNDDDAAGDEPDKLWEDSRKRTAASTAGGVFGNVSHGGATTAVRRGG